MSADLYSKANIIYNIKYLKTNLKNASYKLLIDVQVTDTSLKVT